MLGALALAACGPADPGPSPPPDEGSPFSELQFTVDFGYNLPHGSRDVEFVSAEDAGGIPVLFDSEGADCSDAWYLNLTIQVAAFERDGSPAVMDPELWPLFVPSVHMDEVGLLEQSYVLPQPSSEEVEGGWEVTSALWSVPAHPLDLLGHCSESGLPDPCALYGSLLNLRLEVRDPLVPFAPVLASESAQVMVTYVRYGNPRYSTWTPDDVDCTGEEP